MRKAPKRGRVMVLSLSRTNRVLGHARLSPGLECTGLSSPHPSPPCSRNIRVTKTLVQTKFPSSSSVPDESAPHSCPSSIPPSLRCCTWAERSAAGGCGPPRRCPPEARSPSADKAAEESLQFLGERFQKTSSVGTLAESQRGTCSPTSHGTGYANLSFESPPPLGAFVGGGSLHILTRSGRACTILAARGRELTWISIEERSKKA